MDTNQPGGRYGATVDEWVHFAETLGLTADLLPVVSNPKAVISTGSNIKEQGKVPSVYNPEGKLIGIPGWTSRIVVPGQVENWKKQPDYGICIQTRLVRAIDVDVENGVLATEIANYIYGVLGFALPSRGRAGSFKFLLAFKVQGEYGKRIIKTAHGAIEFLANGQQFIAAGTHPKGMRYSWIDLGDEIPEITPEQMEEILTGLQMFFGVEESTAVAVPVNRKAQIASAVQLDDTANWLLSAGWVKSQDRSGALHITCPFASEHSPGAVPHGTAKGGSDTTYFTAHTNGFARGHFKCLHAHCASRTDLQFRTAIGMTVDDFAQPPLPTVQDTVSAVSTQNPPPNASLEDAQSVIRSLSTTRSGIPEPTADNLHIVLACAPLASMRIGWDSFRDELMVTPNGAASWRPFKDGDYIRLRRGLEKRLGFRGVSKELLRDVVKSIGEDNTFDSARVWGESLQWDGVARVDGFLHECFGAEQGDYATALGRYLWTALAGRLIDPGTQVDMMPILVGRQGIYKSTGVKAMAPAVEHYVELALDIHDADLARKMRGTLVGEVGELRGLASRDLESIKALITRTHEKWVPKYMEFTSTFARRIVLIGTTNRREFLSDDTGNRRFLPIAVKRAHPAKIRAERDQLWAEGLSLFKEKGVLWQDAERLGAPKHAEHMIGDAWEDPFHDWLERAADAIDDFGGGVVNGKAHNGHPVLNGERGFTISDVLVGAVGMAMNRITKREEMRAANVLGMMGYERSRTFQNGAQKRTWKKVKQVDGNERDHL